VNHSRMGQERQLSPILTRTFRADRQAPGKARSALHALNGSLDPEIADDVRLLVSELVTNSLRHTGSSQIELRVSGSDSVIHVDVVDNGGGFDMPLAPEPGQASGWGLFMVDRLADRWGVETDRTTRVWFEFCRQHAEGDGRHDFFAPAL
jgi:anti-sigma regulatory factor (Ser/Thr protein kinase)